MSNIGRTLEHVSTRIDVPLGPDGLPTWWGTDADSFTAYGILRRDCCNTYRNKKGFGEEMQAYSDELIERSGQQVLVGAAAGIAADCLEAGMR